MINKILIKWFKSLFFILLFIFFFSANTYAADPTPISTCDQLEAINTDATTLSANYIQTADFSCSGIDNFIPIGINSAPFTGTYDGNGKQITDVIIDRGLEDYVGLFGYLSSPAKVINVNLAGSVNGGTNVGAIAGFADTGTEINNTSTFVSVMGVTNVGGLVGVNKGNINNANTQSSVVNSDDNGNVGGLVGLNEDSANITDSFALGSISNNGNAGGFVGACVNWSGTITGSASTGAVQGTQSVGGFVGLISADSTTGKITKSHSLGSVNIITSTTEKYVGGFVGLNNGIIDQVYDLGAVGGYSSNYVSGGVAGKNNGQITNAYQTGSVDGDTYSGGIVGINTGTVANTYATSWYSANGIAGGIAGINTGTITNSYYNSDNSSFSDGGTPQTGDELLLQNTYQPGDPNNWDFGQIWTMDSNYNNGLPYFQWQNLAGSASGSSQDFVNDVVDRFITLTGTLGDTSQATFNTDYTINTGNSTITLPSDTDLTVSGGGNFNFSDFSASNNTAVTQSELSNVVNSVKLGLPDTNVLFSNPITISIFVGDSYDGQTLTVYSKLEGSSDWNLQTTCEVSGSYCTFQTNHATTYAAIGNSISQNSGNNNSSNSSQVSGPPSCNDAKPVTVPDLFQINTDGTTAKLFFTPISNSTGFFISFSTKPNAEEHGALVDLYREGVQNFKVNLLKPNTTYYFKVRGQNGCKPGDWSTILKATTREKGITAAKLFYKYLPFKLGLR